MSRAGEVEGSRQGATARRDWKGERRRLTLRSSSRAREVARAAIPSPAHLRSRERGRRGQRSLKSACHANSTRIVKKGLRKSTALREDERKITILEKKK